MKKSSFRLIDLWRSDENYSNYRIPGMIVTKRQTLIVYCEARRTSSDWSMMDIIMQRSTNNGETFAPPIVLAHGTKQHPTVNNPVMVEDQNGRIHFLYCEDYTINGGRVLRRYSDDDGISWSEPIDISEFAMPKFHNAFALGPGHGVKTPKGTLIIPIWMVPKHYNAPLNSHSPSVISTFYSKDNGQTWAIGDILTTTADVINPNETAAAITSDGKVYLNIRTVGYHRAKAYSENGYSDFYNYATDYKLPDPHCFGSLAVYDHEDDPYSLIFVNCNHQTSRKNVCVRASLDDGKNFAVCRVIDESRGGYCEVAANNALGLIFVLYEDKFGISDHLAVFDFEWIRQNENIDTN